MRRHVEALLCTSPTCLETNLQQLLPTKHSTQRAEHAGLLGVLDSLNPSLMKLLGQAHPLELGLMNVDYYPTSLQDADDIHNHALKIMHAIRQLAWSGHSGIF